MSSEYVSQDEVDAHKAAMQRVVEEKRGKQEAIECKKKMVMEAAVNDAFWELLASEEESASRLAAMQRDFKHLPLLRQVYHEAPDDVFELIVSKFSVFDKDGGGGMNVLRLVSKRLIRVVESCATRLTQLNRRWSGPRKLPVFLRGCKRIRHIKCDSYNLRSLEGCPDGLRSLDAVGASLTSLEPLRSCTQLERLDIKVSTNAKNATQISDLGPLEACTRLKKLTIIHSQVTDISALSSMPLLNELNLYKKNQSSIKDLSPLIQCQRLVKLRIGGNRDIKDISPLAQCTRLELLWIPGLSVITNLKPLSFLTKLKSLGLTNVPAKPLTPLSALQNLKELWCCGIPLPTSLLPLAQCSSLSAVHCDENVKDLGQLRMERHDVEFHTRLIEPAQASQANLQLNPAQILYALQQQALIHQLQQQ